MQRNEYEPWGEVSRSEGATPGSSPTVDLNHRFTGQELDPETGLHYYGGRYYDQEIGRFASPDPYVQEPDNPQNLNRYTYVLDNPQNYVDPSGHFFWELITFLAASFAASMPEVAIGLTFSTAQAFATVVSTAFFGSLHWAASVAGKSELTQLSQNRAADQHRSVDKTRPQGENRLAQDGLGNDDPNKNPWWNLNWWPCLVCDAQAQTDDEGGGKTRTRVDVRYGVIQRVPLERPMAGRMSQIWHDRTLFKRWLHVEQTTKRINTPLTHDEAKMLINQAREVGIPKKAFDFNADGLAGKELRRPFPHFKIEDAHIPIEKGFQPPW